MIFTFGNCTIDVDVEKTKAFYETYTYSCTCDACRNFINYAESSPDALRAWFADLGLDIGKPGEVYDLWKTENGRRMYGGWWHLCGTVLTTDYRTEDSGEGYGMILYDAYPVTAEFRVTFHDKCHCVPEGFPNPRIQMEVTAYVPAPKE